MKMMALGKRLLFQAVLPTIGGGHSQSSGCWPTGSNGEEAGMNFPEDCVSGILNLQHMEPQNPGMGSQPVNPEGLSSRRNW